MTLNLTIPVEVEFTAYAARRGHRDKYGCPEEPDEPAHIEIDDIKYNDKSIIEFLTDVDIELLTQQIEESAGADEPDYDESDYGDII